MKLIEWINGVTKLNQKTMNEFQNNINSDFTSITKDITSMKSDITTNTNNITKKQDKLTPGEGIKIENNVISATSTGGSDMFKFQDFSANTSLSNNATGTYSSAETLNIPTGYSYLGILPYSTPYEKCQVTWSLNNSNISNGTHLTAIVTNYSGAAVGGSVHCKVIYIKNN